MRRTSATRCEAIADGARRVALQARWRRGPALAGGGAGAEGLQRRRGCPEARQCVLRPALLVYEARKALPAPPARCLASPRASAKPRARHRRKGGAIAWSVEGVLRRSLGVAAVVEAPLHRRRIGDRAEKRWGMDNVLLARNCTSPNLPPVAFQRQDGDVEQRRQHLRRQCCGKPAAWLQIKTLWLNPGLRQHGHGWVQSMNTHMGMCTWLCR